MQQQRQRLLELLKTLSLLQGPVTLASGKTSNFYLDCRQVTLHAEGASLIGSLVYKQVESLRRQGIALAGVGGLSLGADPIAVATAIASHHHGQAVHAFIVRKAPKTHGTQQFLEGTKNLQPGAALLVVEDVVTTGGSTLRAVERIKNEGFQPAAIVALVDRLEGGGERLASTGVPYHPLFTRRDFEI